ncbi:MAG: hypothetical protein M3154_09840, partial [Candidatus Eremiobacteraeota bacterium]|nr:hypothetical protein [Candidatus Eremiobacteraeota bacterium]
MRPRKPTLVGALVGMSIGLLPVVAFMAFLYFGLTLMPYSDDPCLNDTRRANIQIGDAEQHQDAAAMAAAYDRGIKGLTECLRDPQRAATIGGTTPRRLWTLARRRRNGVHSPPPAARGATVRAAIRRS